MLIPEIIQKGSIIKADIQGIKLLVEFKNNQIINLQIDTYRTVR